MVRTVGALIVAIAAAACSGGARPEATAATPAKAAAASVPPASTGPRIEIADLYHLRSAGDVQFAPDGARVAFTVTNNDRPGAPWTQIWIADLAAGKAERWRGADEGSTPRWSRDGSRLAF